MISYKKQQTVNKIIREGQIMRGGAMISYKKQQTVSKDTSLYYKDKSLYYKDTRPPPKISAKVAWEKTDHFCTKLLV